MKAKIKKYNQNIQKCCIFEEHKEESDFEETAL